MITGAASQRPWTERTATEPPARCADRWALRPESGIRRRPKQPMGSACSLADGRPPVRRCSQAAWVSKPTEPGPWPGVRRTSASRAAARRRSSAMVGSVPPSSIPAHLVDPLEVAVGQAVQPVADLKLQLEAVQFPALLARAGHGTDSCRHRARSCTRGASVHSRKRRRQLARHQQRPTSPLRGRDTRACPRAAASRPGPTFQ